VGITDENPEPLASYSWLRATQDAIFSEYTSLYSEKEEVRKKSFGIPPCTPKNQRDVVDFSRRSLEVVLLIWSSIFGISDSRIRSLRIFSETLPSRMYPVSVATFV
jgi:hypothetical protein